MSRTRALVVPLVAALLAVLVAGCGGGAGTSAAPAKKAATPTSDDVAAFVEKVTNAMAEKRTAKLTIALGSSMSATADVDYADAGVSMAMKMITGTQTVRLVLADGTMYLQQAKGSKYLKIGKDDPALGSLLDQVSSIGPKSALQGVKAGIKKVRNLGPQMVDGEKLTHYELTVDTSKVTTGFGILKGSGKTAGTVTYDVWVDGEFLLREVRMTVSGQKLVMKASDWGKPVTITVPSASQVVTR